MSWLSDIPVKMPPESNYFGRSSWILWLRQAGATGRATLGQKDLLTAAQTMPTARVKQSDPMTT
jgi:hypothetical protein